MKRLVKPAGLNVVAPITTGRPLSTAEQKMIEALRGMNADEVSIMVSIAQNMACTSERTPVGLRVIKRGGYGEGELKND